MKTVDITPGEMEKHIARFANLERIENEYARREGVPPEALRMIAADRITRSCPRVRRRGLRSAVAASRSIFSIARPVTDRRSTRMWRPMRVSCA